MWERDVMMWAAGRERLEHGQWRQRSPAGGVSRAVGDFCEQRLYAQGYGITPVPVCL
ncbi:hypothetical protein KIN20_033625 [Parelaphostrongylus tenuis]|uniref:Uncharacterized protein n=1 Tax=Parelaphostrongylus tenuis TaxID=148309 RepID=A0AAD5R8Z4_PARTN|nr:hypothetical protein KIN20_033625 [Parelaphostrongylus tenuis]